MAVNLMIIIPLVTASAADVLWSGRWMTYKKEGRYVGRQDGTYEGKQEGRRA